MLRHRILPYVPVTALFLLFLAAILPPDQALSLTSLQLTLVAVVALVSLCLPPASGLALCLTLFGIAAILDFVNTQKIQLTQFPLTIFDLEIALANPRGLFDATAIPHVAGYGLLAGLGLTTISTPLALLWERRHFSTPSKNMRTLIAVVLAVSTSSLLLTRAIHIAKSGDTTDLWSPEGVVRVANEMGIIPFLALTASTTDASLFFSAMDQPAPPPAGGSPQYAADIAPELEAFREKGVQPNIVFMLLESTFDVERSFAVTPPLNTPMRASMPEAALSGPLRVNVIGGGTWVTEFEVLTGLDWRWFGLPGYYTHTAIAPYMRGGFASYLRKLGYSAMAYYPVSGDFYGARTAYAHYGFEEFRDVLDLGLPDDWSRPDDELVAAIVKDLDKTTGEKPFFTMLLTISNHSPHRCRGDTPIDHVFAAGASDHQNCELNVFIQRMRSTERAVSQMERFLKHRQEQSGRPYILVLFGDHVPHTFSGTSTSTSNYEALWRRPKTETFYQVRTSLADAGSHHEVPRSATELASLVSHMIMNLDADTYLPGSLTLHGKCGADFAPDLQNGLGLIPEGDALNGMVPRSATALRGTGGSGASSDCSSLRSRFIVNAREQLFSNTNGN